MFQPLHIPAGSFNANRIIEPLNEGRQILIEFEAANRTCKVTVRLSEDGVYYINEPLSRSTLTSEGAMRQWLINQGYGTE
jgi:hypothetical protein